MDPLSKAERSDGYRAACAESELNGLARAGHSYTVFSQEKAKPFQEIANGFELSRGMQIIMLHPSADNGYPHTRPTNLICLPSTFSNNRLAPQTILHEACHVLQRKNPDPWTSYSINQGWWPIASELIPERWASRCRINPDTMARPFWSWQNHYVPLPLFMNELSPTMADCEVRWWDMRNGVLFPDPPASFVKRYGGVTQTEHPWETSAVEFSGRGIKTHSELMNVLKTE